LYERICVRGNVIFTSAVTIPMRELQAQPYWFLPHMRASQDLELWLRVLDRGRALFVPRVLSHCRRRPGSVTSSRERYLRGVIDLHEPRLRLARRRFGPESFWAFRRRVARFHLDLGKELLKRDAAAEALRHHARAFRLDPRSDTMMLLLKGLLPPRLRTALARARAAVRAVIALCLLLTPISESAVAAGCGGAL
jgi:hypothetical protein